MKVRGFAQELAKGIAPVPVRLVDERMTTVTAGQSLRASGVRSKKGRSVIDQAAAVIILQQALESERVSGEPPARASKWSSDRDTVTFRAMRRHSNSAAQQEAERKPCPKPGDRRLAALGDR
ncbi:hypothetical protein GCM10020295_68810 [Streptomyces cinereospinus]